MEYHVNFGHTLGRIQHIPLLSIIGICYATLRLENQTVAPNLPGFQGINSCVQYLDIHPNKPISNSSNYYDRSNVIITTWSENQVEDHTIGYFGKSGSKNCAMECSNIGAPKGTYDAVILDKGERLRVVRSYADVTREDVQTPLGKNRLIGP